MGRFHRFNPGKCTQQCISLNRDTFVSMSPFRSSSTDNFSRVQMTQLYCNDLINVTAKKTRLLVIA